MQTVGWGALAGLTIMCMTGAMSAPTAEADVAALGQPSMTCITRSQVVEGTTREWCAAQHKDEYERLRAEGLADDQPVLVVRANGHVLRGQTTATLVGGHGRVVATDGRLTCGADYKIDASSPVVIRFRCSDGRTGVAIRASAFPNQGEGTIVMSDGEVAQFAFGCSTRVGDIRTCPVVQAVHPTLVAQPLPRPPSR
jgi:hypothetical protein